MKLELSLLIAAAVSSLMAAVAGIVMQNAHKEDQRALIAAISQPMPNDEVAIARQLQYLQSILRGQANLGTGDIRMETGIIGCSLFSVASLTGLIILRIGRREKSG